MKYLVFEFDQYYPCGGWNDFVGMRFTLEEAQELVSTLRADNAQIVSLETLQVVWP